MGSRDMIWAGLLGVAFSLASFADVPISHADRVFSPLDSLGDGAIDTTIAQGGPSGRNMTGDRALQFRLGYWPIDGLVLGTELAYLAKPSKSGISQGLMDPSFRVGYLETLPLDISVRADLHVTLPLGNELASLGRTSVEVETLIGFSGPGNTHAFFRPILGYRSAGVVGHVSVVAGWSAGVAYQPSRFSISIAGATHWHLNFVRGARVGGAGIFAVGYELTRGLSLRFDINFRTEPEVNSGAGYMTLGGIGLEWVYFTGDRKNTYRTAPDDDDSSFSAAEHW